MAEKTRKAGIMLAEDEGIVARDIAGALNNRGYDVCAIVSSGEDAVKRALELSPDIVLMDIGLKGKTDGIDAAMEIKNHMHIPVIYLTAYSDEKTLKRAMITEPFGYILKPYEERELHTAIEMALYKHQMEQKLRESEEWLSTILDNIGDAVIATDTDGRIRFINPLAQEIASCTPDRALNRPLQDALDDRIWQIIKPMIDRSLSTGKASYARGIEYLARPGKRYVIDMFTNTLVDGEQIKGSVITIRDVTEKKILKDKVRTLEKKEVPLTEKDKQVLYGLVKYPEMNDIELSGTLGVKRSTFTGIRNKLEKEGFFKTIRVPDMSSLGYELLTVSYCNFSGCSPDPVIEQQKKELACPDLFHSISTDNEHCCFGSSRNITEYMERTGAIQMEYDRLKIIKEYHTIYFPYSLSDIMLFNYGMPIKRWFDLKDLEKAPVKNKPKGKRGKDLTENEGRVLYALTKYPDLSDKALAKKASLGKITVSQIKKRLMDDGYIATVRIPSLKKLGCELFFFMHAKLNPENKKAERQALISSELCPLTYIEGARDAVIIAPFRNYTEYKTVFDNFSRKQADLGLFMEDPKALLIPINKILSEKLDYAALAKDALSIKENI